ncbi:MAG: FkbM family methyltransferase [Saprospiraceae bacterium]
MRMPCRLEKMYVSLIACFARHLSFLPTYRVALLLYPLNSSLFQGFYLIKSYLKSNYGLKIKLWSKGLIDHKVLFTGTYESDTNIILERYIKSGNVVIEAGANIGTETLLLSRLVGHQGKVLAFEPVPNIANRLAENCRLNGLDNVVLEQLALGESNDTISFFVADETFTNQGMGSKYPVNQHLTKEININQITLDAYMKSAVVDSIDFIKMDIQGAELDLLKGGAETISHYLPSIFLEASEGWSSLSDLYEWLTDKGYDVFLIQKDTGLTLITCEEIYPGNWFAKPVGM